jgi:DNA transformation protein
MMKDPSFRDFVLEQLSALNGLAVRPMFGGDGLYLSVFRRSGCRFGVRKRDKLRIKSAIRFCESDRALDGEFFGMIWKGRLWFRTDAASLPNYRALGAEPIPFGDDPDKSAYWSVPADVLEDASLLVTWATAAAMTPRRTARISAPAAKRAPPRKQPTALRRKRRS